MSTLYIICLFSKHVLEAFVSVSFLYVQCQKVHLIGLDILIDISMSFLAVIVYALFSFPPFSPWWSSMQYSLIMLWCCEILIAGLIFQRNNALAWWSLWQHSPVHWSFVIPYSITWPWTPFQEIWKVILANELNTKFLIDLLYVNLFLKPLVRLHHKFLNQVVWVSSKLPVLFPIFYPFLFNDYKWFYLYVRQCNSTQLWIKFLLLCRSHSLIYVMLLHSHVK